MNKIRAVISEVHSDPFFNIVTLNIGGETLKLLKTSIPSWCETGLDVECFFQIAAVSVVTGGCKESVSIENRIGGKVLNYRRGSVLCEVHFETGIGEITSLITTDAFERLGLEEGVEAILLLKAVDIMIERARIILSA